MQCQKDDLANKATALSLAWIVMLTNSIPNTGVLKSSVSILSGITRALFHVGKGHKCNGLWGE
jgi:hypothetical protein